MPNKPKPQNNANDRKIKQPKGQSKHYKSLQKQARTDAEFQQKQSAQVKTDSSISADMAAELVNINKYTKDRVAAAKKHLDSACEELQQHLESLEHIEEYTPELYEDLQLKIKEIQKRIAIASALLVKLGDNSSSAKIKKAENIIDKIYDTFKALAIQDFLNDLDNHFVDMDEQLRSAQERSDLTNLFTSRTSNFFKFQRIINELKDCKKACEKQCTEKNAAPEKAIETLKTGVKAILLKKEHVQLLNKHRGSYAWRGLINILEKLEIWLRELMLPWTGHNAPINTARARYFSTKSSKKAEEFIENIDNLQAPHIKKF